MTRLHPFQEPSQPPAAAARAPVVVSPPQFDYVPWSTGLCNYFFDFEHYEEAAQDRREGHRGLCPLMVLRVVRLQPRVSRASESRIRPVRRLVDSVERQNHRVMMASLPPVALVLADGMDR
ncbi:uncharacterized protein LOC104433229 isoform X2 [Eucalyptus grandis]|uniref:uncharacterized protein LOC104433229 isoform X2 n=1 Tax=Eucalyptus grandis TaxID=71139 RepID=UPI00192F00BA|nr:uncharacterized protein LOC104433229 isoform X2 [Eucalyptus grandis]